MGNFFNSLLYKRLGWKKEVTVEHPKKFIIALAPHTSNWDFALGQCYSRAEKMRINFLMKKEWFFWPLGPIFRKWGGVPVYRSKSSSMTDNLAEEARKMDELTRIWSKSNRITRTSRENTLRNLRYKSPARCFPDYLFGHVSRIS